MNRLWIHLSLAFSAVVFVSFITVSIISLFIIRMNIVSSNLDTNQYAIQVRDSLINYYQSTSSWDHVDSFFKGMEAIPLPLPFRERKLAFSLTDANGQVIYDNLSSETVLVSTLPLTLNGQPSLTLTINLERDSATASPNNETLIPPFVQPEEIILLITFVGAVIGILFGILMSRTLTSSLDDLVQATAEIGAGKLNRRVAIKGTEEIALLTKSFNDMVGRLERAETLRRNIVGDVAHELRTPITALQANIYAILDDAYPMTKTEIAGLYEQTRLLSRLVNDLHELSQAEARQLPMNRRGIDLSRSLEEFSASFRSVAENKGVLLQLTIPDHLPPVYVDEDRIHQVFHNVLSNAIRHTPTGGRVDIYTQTYADYLQIYVKDTGEGITSEHLPNVFERFYRADYARSRDAGGTGLGLAIARAIVEAHEGKITVESAGISGQGTTFIIYLPITDQMAQSLLDKSR